MRLSLVTLIAAAFTSTLSLAASTDQIAATKHNFTTGTYAMPGSTICQPCHTPHHAIVNDQVSTRLWNHALSTATYTLYEKDANGVNIIAPYAKGTVDGNQGMDRVSRLCLGCHDGTLALDSFGMDADGNPTRPGTKNFNAGDLSNLGTDFRDDHPVGVSGKALNADGTPVSPYLKAAALTYKTAGDPTSGVKSAKIGALNLMTMTDGTGFVVGCKTCHNPHGQGTTTNTPYAHLLYVDPAALCNTCHYK